MSEAMKARQLDLAKQVLDHALANYSHPRQRWDHVFECYSAQEIADELTENRIYSKSAAIRYWKQHAKLQHEARLNTEAHLHAEY